MKRHLMLVAAALFLFMAVPASAQLWNSAGSTGIVDESALGLFEFAGPTLKFKTGQVGTITARYPIHSDVTNPGWGSMWIAYAGPGVTVKLIEVGDCAPTETVVTTFNNPNAPDANICEGHIYGPFTWNFAQRSYYIEVTLTRATTATNPRFNRIDIP